MIQFAKLGAGELRRRMSGELQDNDLGCTRALQLFFGLAAIRGVF